MKYIIYICYVILWYTAQHAGQANYTAGSVWQNKENKTDSIKLQLNSQYHSSDDIS